MEEIKQEVRRWVSKYKSNDGRVFNTKAQCIDYEARMNGTCRISEGFHCSLPEVLQESQFVVEFTKGVELFSWKVNSFLVCDDFASFDLLVLTTDKPDDTVNYLLEHREKETLVDFKVTFLDATGVACYTKEYKDWKIQDAVLHMYGDTSSKNPLTINFQMTN